MLNVRFEMLKDIKHLILAATAKRTLGKNSKINTNSMINRNEAKFTKLSR
jgi:hypothetical protein